MIFKSVAQKALRTVLNDLRTNCCSEPKKKNKKVEERSRRRKQRAAIRTTDRRLRLDRRGDCGMPDVVVMGPKVIMDVSSSIEGVLLGQKTTKQKKKQT
jgi:hypothetical protein